MRIAAFLLCTLMGLPATLAQSPLPPIPAPYPAARAPQPVLPSPGAPSLLQIGPSGPTARLEHLIEAAVHLEAAGERGQADQTRRLIAQERERLQGSLAVSGPVAAGQQVLVHVRLLEIKHSHLEKLDLPIRPQHSLTVIHPSSAELASMLKTLLEDKGGRMLAAPTLVGVSGRPVSFHSGGELPVRQAGGQVDPVEYGTHVDLVPLVLPNDTIRMELKVVLAEPLSPIPTRPDFPKVRTRTVNTNVELKSGHTCVLTGIGAQAPEANKGPDETWETVCLITPEIVK